MEAQLLGELLKQSPLIAVLGIGLYVFYKKDENRRNEDKADRLAIQAKVDAQEHRIEEYMKNDRALMQDIVATNAKAIVEQTVVMKSANNLMTRSTEVMNCLISEIKVFKKSQIFQQHEKSKAA